MDEFFRRFGGVSFKTDTRRTAIARALGIALRAPGFVLGRLPGYVWHWLQRLSPGAPMQALRELLERVAAGAAAGDRQSPLHECGRNATEEGQARLAQCVFHVPVNGELVSMCEVNALGIRDRYYAALAGADATEPALRD